MAHNPVYTLQLHTYAPGREYSRFGLDVAALLVLSRSVRKSVVSLQTTSTGKMDDGNEHEPTQPTDLEIIFYLPDHAVGVSLPPVNRGSGIPTWERLAGHISTATTFPRLRVEECLQLLPKYSGDTALQAASSLASSISQDKERRSIQGILLLSLCIVLDMSGRAPRAKIDSIIEVLTKSSKPRYLDTLKRGARVANEIIAEWAGRRGGDHLQQLDQATQAVLQGKGFIDSFQCTV